MSLGSGEFDTEIEISCDFEVFLLAFKRGDVYSAARRAFRAGKREYCHEEDRIQCRPTR
jgi:hypothetical protein